MRNRYDLSGMGERARCVHEGGPGSVRVWMSPHTPTVVQIDTPTVYNRTRWTLAQARHLRAVLDAAIRAGERA
ncbi:hypothetical protein SAMN04487904_103276 [Actinopolyspora lacussalsi subsp. righensis]|uniref:DUF397 domain-containing protein n=1 Tax=Actinopolyspora righensis TaxID=995060 RepID=A0A1I6YV81_9ACTN|nr:hypothetical protein [Actinopolyspora righensis]SFT54425.1 hypothetical protein SAMN04487904_103276 [Actinopolyspora righensis]